jgi:hypothetical protein
LHSRVSNWSPRLIEISGESGAIEVIDENMLPETMPDFILFLPKD